MKDFKFENIHLTKIKPHPKNYREHPEDQILHLVQSIQEHGFYRNVVISKDNIILAGHGVVQAVKKIGMKSIPVIRLNVKSDSPKALKILTGDNEIGHLGEVDDRKLTEILKEINNFEENGLLGTGYDDAMLANLAFVTRPKSEIKDFDAASEWIGMPDFEPKVKGKSIVVHFETEQDIEDFATLTCTKIKDTTKFIWFPPRKRDDVKSIRFEPNEQK